MKEKQTGADPVKRGAPSLKIDARRDRIMELLERDGQARITQLAELLETTAVTIRSDLDSMERDGLVERVPGGAVCTTMGLYNREFLRRKRLNTEEKLAIAGAVIDEVEDGDTLFINGGSTTYFATLMLKRTRKKLIVVTNSISAAIELGTSPTFTVILVGGQINSFYSFTYGAETLEQLGRYQVNRAILSVDGLDRGVVTTIHPEESAVSAKMIERARRTVILADRSKIGRDGFSTICRADEIDALITNRGADPETLEALRALGVKVQEV